MELKEIPENMTVYSNNKKYKGKAPANLVSDKAIEYAKDKLKKKKKKPIIKDDKSGSGKPDDDKDDNGKSK